MSNCPRLNKAGIKNPEQIVEYSVNSINFVDYLQVTYERPKGSLLPATRVLRFPRVQKKTDINNDGQDETVMESSPKLKEALDELQKIVKAKECTANIAEVLTEELRCLEKDFTSHVENIKALIASLPKA